jgi:hypothetical protein
MKTAITKAKSQTVDSGSEQRIERIAEMSHAIDRAIGGIVMLAMKIGDELAAEKAARPHGEFLPWLESNIERMGLKSTRTAREYMNLAANREQIEQLPEITSIRGVFRALGRGSDTPAKAAEQESPMPELGDPITQPNDDSDDHAKPVNPRSRRAFALTHIPPELHINPKQLRRVLDWYESDQLATEYRAANGSSSKPKPRKPKARVSAVVKPKAKRELERRAKRNDITQGELIEQLLTFADQVEKQLKMNRTGGDR